MKAASELRYDIERRLRRAKAWPSDVFERQLGEILVELALDLAVRLERVELKMSGICPGCRTKPVKIALTDVDNQYPEYAKRLREQGIDPRNGHALGCPEITP